MGQLIGVDLGGTAVKLGRFDRGQLIATALFI
jgi:predicted NBD/HSP70 family sugar kinase